MKLIQTITLASTATSIVFDNIPQTGDEIIIYCSLRANQSASLARRVRVLLNTQTISSQYTTNRVYQTASSSFTADNGGDYVIFQPVSGEGTSVFGTGYIQIANYTNTEKKVVLADSYAASADFGGFSVRRQEDGSGGSGPITRVTLSVDTAVTAFAIGSTASLYITQ